MPIVAEELQAAAGGARAEPFLRNVSISMRDGELTLIVGRTGSGKTTLLDALTGLRELQAGSVRYDGVSLWRGRKVNPMVNRRIGAVFQQPEQQLFAATVRNEFRYSLRHLALSRTSEEARIRAALAPVGLGPDILERSPFELSTGQQRRVALATAFAAAPDWLFLDEPTSALDPDGVRALAGWLCRWRAESGCSMVVVTHDLDTFLPLADRIIVMNSGTIAADFSLQELIQRPELLTEAGIGLPAYMETSLLLQHAGLGVCISPNADEMADAIGTAMRQRMVGMDRPVADESGSRPAMKEHGEGNAHPSAAESGNQFSVNGVGERRAHSTVDGGWSQFPAREKESGMAHRSIDEYDARYTLRKREVDAALTTTDESEFRFPAGEPGSGRAHLSTGERKLRNETSAEMESAASAADSRPERLGWAQLLDPRAKWVFLLAVTTGMLMQRTWPGVGCSLALTAALVVAARVPLRPFFRMLRAYLLFSSVSVCVAGLAWSGDSWRSGFVFSFNDALATALSLLRLAPAMLLGLLFAQTTPPMTIKRSLERMLSPLKRLRAQADMLTFAVSMLFRLLPLLTAQLERFSRIVRIRGKSGAKPGSLALRDVPGVLAPLLVTSFQLVEQLALAIEAKGYRFGRPRTSSVRLHFGGKDVWTAALGLALLLGFIMLR